MKICHVINSLSTGGAEKLLVNIARTNKNHPIVIITLFKSEGIPLELAKKHNIRVIELNNTKKYDITIISKLKKQLVDFDIVHAHLFPSTYYVGLVRFNGLKVLTEHSTYNKRRKKRYRLIELFIYGKYKKIYCISDGVKNELLNNYPSLRNKTKVVYNGIEKDFFEKNKNNKTFNKNKIHLISVGSLSVHKNHQLLIKVIKELDNCCLSIIGDGPLKKELKNLIILEGLEKKVFLKGNNNDIASLLKGADIFILPSKWEGFGLVVLEAMASRLVTIVSDVPGLTDIAIDNFNSLTIKGKNESEQKNSLIENINNLIDNEKLRERLIKQAYETSKEYSIEKTVKKLEESYNNLF